MKLLFLNKDGAEKSFWIDRRSSFILNSYGNQLFSYPKPLLRNLIGYQTYALKVEEKISKIIADVKKTH